jgi:dienelactone hydrolase
MTTAEKLHQLMGSIEKPCRADWQTCRTIPKNGYVQYELTCTTPDDRIPGSLMVPDHLAAPAPALLAIHGHGDGGKRKITDPLRKNPAYGYGEKLVRRGYVVLAIDMPGFGDRQIPRPAEKTPWVWDAERFLFCDKLLSGITLAGMCMRDLGIAFDYLSNRAELVDRTRIGVIGHSMGGSLAALFMLLESGTAAGVAAAGLSTWAALSNEKVIHNYAVYIPGLLRLGDLDSLLTGIAPRPFMIIAGKRDPNFPADGVQCIIDSLKRSYTQSGAPQAFQAFVHSGGHPFELEHQDQAIEFLDKFLTPEGRK